MSTLPTALKALIAAALAASIAAAFFGPPPRRRRPLAVRALAVLGLLLYAGAAFALLERESVTAGALLVMAGVEAVCLAGWLVRGRDDDDRGPPGEDVDRDDHDGSGGELATFEGALRRWRRERPRAPVA